jgi:tetratricopeptide (TPR) repeat protein
VSDKSIPVTALVSWLSLGIALSALVFSCRGDSRAEAQLRVEKRQHLIAVSEALATGDLETARHSVDLAKELGQNDPEVIWYEGRVEFATGRLVSAGKLFERALDIRPDYLQARASLAWTRSAQNRLTEGLAILGDDGCGGPPGADVDGKVRIYLTYANIYTKLGRLGGVAGCYEEAEKLDPTNSTVLWGLGNVYHQKEQFEMAINYYAKALQANPRSRLVLSSLASAAYLAHSFAVAEQAARRVVELDQSPIQDHHDLEFLALVLEAQDKKEEARYFRERARDAKGTLERFLAGISTDDGA